MRYMRQGDIVTRKSDGKIIYIIIHTDFEGTLGWGRSVDIDETKIEDELLSIEEVELIASALGEYTSTGCLDKYSSIEKSPKQDMHLDKDPAQMELNLGDYTLNTEHDPTFDETPPEQDDLIPTPGDTVELKSGGPDMTVTEVRDGQAHLVWFNAEGEIARATITLTALQLVEESPTNWGTYTTSPNIVAR